MAVKLHLLPEPLSLPSPPRLLHWIGLLLGLLVLGVVVTALFTDTSSAQSPMQFWLFALGVPSICWLLLAGGRWVLYAGQRLSIEGWNLARERDILQQVQYGRRSLQILRAVAQTAFFDKDKPAQQNIALMKNEKALKAQCAWNGEKGVRHSQIPHDADSSIEERIRKAFVDVLNAMANELKTLPKHWSIKLVLDVETALQMDKVDQIWRTVWAESAIQRPFEVIEGCGLSVIDEWLDTRIQDDALLLIIALQINPAQLEMHAESVAGLLLANRLTQKTLLPLAYLHRPECATAVPLAYAMQQSLDWVPLQPAAIHHVWLSGLDKEMNAGVLSALDSMNIDVTTEKGLYDFTTSLGAPQCVAPWLAIAVAAQAATDLAMPQLIASNDASQTADVWSAVISPAK